MIGLCLKCREIMPESVRRQAWYERFESPEARRRLREGVDRLVQQDPNREWVDEETRQRFLRGDSGI